MQTGEEIKIPSKEEFLNQLWAINPEGNQSFTITKLNTLIINRKTTFNNFVKKYQEYYNAKSTKQYGQYTAKKDKIVTIGEFIDQALYEQSFSNEVIKTDPVLDNYLFGPDIINKEE